MQKESEPPYVGCYGRGVERRGAWLGRGGGAAFDASAGAADWARRWRTAAAAGPWRGLWRRLAAGSKAACRDMRCGSGRGAWLASGGVAVPELCPRRGAWSGWRLMGSLRGVFVLANAVRPETDELLRGLGARYELALLSGDNEKERERFRRPVRHRRRAAFQPEPAGQAGLHPPAAGIRARR